MKNRFNLIWYSQISNCHKNVQNFWDGLLAFRETEAERGVSLRRQVAIGGNYRIDGMSIDGCTPIGVEIKFVRGPGYHFVFGVFCNNQRLCFVYEE